MVRAVREKLTFMSVLFVLETRCLFDFMFLLFAIYMQVNGAAVR